MSFDRNLAIVGFIISLLSTAFAIWTYIDTRQFSQITYSIVHETLYRPSKAIDTALLLQSGSNQVTGRVTQTVFTIWNGGNVPFKGEEIRSKLSITGDSSVSLLSHKVVLTKVLPGSSGFSVSGDDKHLEIDWRIFDPEEGLQIAILSTGNSESLNISGRFLPGQEIVRYPVRSPLKTISLFMVFIGGILAVLLFFSISSRYIGRITPYNAVNSLLKIVGFAVIFVAYVSISYFILRTARLYIGDISPIDPGLLYIDLNQKLDYRYVPM